MNENGFASYADDNALYRTANTINPIQDEGLPVFLV